VVIYYIGHGVPVSRNDDVSLSVSDEPVGEGYGIPVRDFMDRALKKFYPGIRKIPHVVLIIESCYSGAAAPLADGFKPASEPIGGTDSRRRLVFVSATGAREEATELKGTGSSAFSVFFASGLDSDWTCADENGDGALTVQELTAFASK